MVPRFRVAAVAAAVVLMARKASCGSDQSTATGLRAVSAHVPISAVPAYGHGLDGKKDKSRGAATHFSAERGTDSKHAAQAQHRHQGRDNGMEPLIDKRAHEKHDADKNIAKDAIGPFFDRFWFTYWGSATAFVAALWFYMKYAPPPAFDVFSTDLKAETHTGEKREGYTPFHRSTSRPATSLLEYTFRPPDGVPLDVGEEHSIPENMWALILVAALGHAKLRNGRSVTPWMVATVALFMGILQMMALFLMSHDLDPKADPVTVNPSSPYGSPWTVNTMKCVMAVFMVVALVSEAGECQCVAEITSSLPAHRLNGCPHWLPMFMALFQYVVSLSVVWAGIAVVLSFQSVPDIIYSSMSIMCIATIDKLFYEGLHAVLGLESKWTTHREEDEEELSLGYLFACKIVLLFPIFLGFFMFIRAWMTGVMPTARMRNVADLIHAQYFS